MCYIPQNLEDYNLNKLSNDGGLKRDISESIRNNKKSTRVCVSFIFPYE